MKRKLFTLLFAFLALASFQLNAQTKYLIWTADTTYTAVGTKLGIMNSGYGYNYASIDALNWVGKLTADWKWVAGAPTNTDQKFYLDQSVGANFTRFVNVTTDAALKLTYSGVDYDKFVIMRNNGSNAGFTIDQTWLQTNQSGQNAPGEDVAHAGYLSVNTSVTPADDNLVIVYVKTSKAPTGDDGVAVGSLKLQTVKYMKDEAIGKYYAPFAFYANPAKGRWAQAKDFANCKYHVFAGLNVAALSTTAPYISGTTYNTFAVTQVDWVAKTDGNQSNENIFGNTGSDYSVPNFTAQNGSVEIGGKNLGLQIGASLPAPVSTTDNIIPLFTLSSPQKSCNVVSVSRQNDLAYQSEVDGGYANKLELREFATYYDYDSTGANKQTITYTKHTAAHAAGWPAHYNATTFPDEYRIATSLQKFAIWIDEDGQYVLYPAAAYFWKYGEKKQNQISSVLPNSVLMYNNIDITQTTGGVAVADQGWGVKIGRWNGKTQNDAGVSIVVTGDINTITTIPNALQSMTNYSKMFFKPTCSEGTGEIGGRFFFLEVDNQKAVGSNSNPVYTAATRKGAYQDNDSTKYVLSVEVRGNTKHLIVIPKERVRSYNGNADNINGKGNKWYGNLLKYKAIEGGALLPDYWSNNPYDSVNMAAHWEIIKQTSADQYVLVNMLGDTLQYDTSNSLTNITGGYLPINSWMASNNFSESVHFYGLYNRQDADPTYPANLWFPQNSAANTANTKSVWTAYYIPGVDDGFVLQLSDFQLKIKDGDWQWGPTPAKTDSLYFQQDVDLVAVASATSIQLVKNNKIDCAGGLILKRTPIYYVPNYAKSYDAGSLVEIADPSNNTWQTINTSDPNYRVGTVKQDSLTAYLQLRGQYGIAEAAKVDNGLMLGITNVEFGAAAAALRIDGAENIEFIPLASSGRTAAIKNLMATSGTSISGLGVNIDTLFGETYKWYVVKLGSKYLTYDTINPTAPNAHLKAGFVFSDAGGAEVALANSTPVRLYQPLVGDKLQGNFIFEFQIPYYTYGKTIPTTYENTWPEWRGGRRVFGELSNQSNYIHAAVDRSKATRFTYVKTGPGQPCECAEEFIGPKWMADEKLLSLPLENRAWKLTAKTDFGFGLATVATNPNKEAVVTKDPAAMTRIKHVFSGDSIINGSWKYKSPTQPARTNTINGFGNELPVPLYYVVNEKGQYLTVDTTTNSYDSHSTVPDVTGVNLVWKDKINRDSLNVWSNGVLNYGALQLFAISGAEADPDTEGWYAGCRTYVYLPLASYKVDYTKGKVLKNEIFYNEGLGYKGDLSCNESKYENNVTAAFRVSQYSPFDNDQKNLIVANASGLGNANVTPVEWKWKKLHYEIIGCGPDTYQLVKNTTKASDIFYYASGGTSFNKIPATGSITTNGSNVILAHWLIKHDANDPELHTFAPEQIIVTEAYDPSGLLNVVNTQLKGSYYFYDVVRDGKKTTAKVIDFSNYTASNKYGIEEHTFEITCIDHTLPFYNLEPEYELPTQLAIIESPYLDRNITDMIPAFPAGTKVNSVSYQGYVNQIGGDINKAKYLKVYKTNVRRLAVGLENEVGHDIPYYAFSVTNPTDNKEYFLNVRRAVKTGEKDSVYWTFIGDGKDQIIADYANGVPNAGSGLYKTFKFCLPYQVKADGTLKEPVKYGEEQVPYQPVYLQTLDTTITDYPYIITIGSGSEYITTKRLSEAILPYSTGIWSLEKNIYSVDYSQIDIPQVTAWILGGQRPDDSEWVPLKNSDGVNPYEDPNAANLNTEGLLANYRVNQAGIFGFLGESNQSPVNYGLLLNKTQLFFEYEGTEKIGTYAKRPIYYYSIQIKGADADKKWLTDSWNEKDAKYTYIWGTGTDVQPYKYAYFGPKIDKDYVNAAGEDRDYDSEFIQTFGLRYTGIDANNDNVVASDKLADKTFTVVSNTKYEATLPGEYRYLAAANGRMVFVQDIKNALVFQFGKDKGGNYTGIDVVGQGDTFGVSGGVRLLDQAGSKVELYAIDGSLIKSVVITGADQTIVAPRGVVIVKVAGKATKVIVK